MLKEAMLGVGAIMLAAATFVSSVTPGAATGGALRAQTAAWSVPPYQPTQPVVSSRPDPVFETESGDTRFGAPMVSTKPLSTISAVP